MTSLMLVVIAGILTFVGAKSTYYIWKVLAGISWIGLGIWWIYSPFTTAGTPPHEIMVSVVFVAGIAAFFWAFWTERVKNGQPTGDGRFRFPFMQTDEQEEESRQERSLPTRKQRVDAYKERIAARLRGED